MVRPATSFLDGLEEIVNSVGSGTLSPAYFPLLDKLDAALIDFCKKAIARSERFATDFLSKYMLSDSPEQAARVAQFFNDSRSHLSHGAVITAEVAEAQGLNVIKLHPEESVWKAYWLLYTQMRMAWQTSTDRLYEGRRTSLLLR